MSKVLFKPVDSYSRTEEISQAARELLERLVKDQRIALESSIPLKVHFGEKGNSTYIGAKNYDGIIDYLQEHDIDPCYMETNALYRGERMTRDSHIRLARSHGFTRVPVVIADGHHGDEFEEVKLEGKHFTKCKIGAGIARQRQILIVAHFKGHMLAGFGGAMKQLAMGCASRGGKLAQHANAKPFINFLFCKKCSTCVAECPEDAITIGTFSRIDKDKCIGCAACIAVCPNGVIKMNILRASVARKFNEKMVVYAYAAQKDKTAIYINFALNITRGCDCMGRNMKPVAPDLGVFASMDPVAIDQACLDMMEKKGGKKRFGGRYSLEYAEKIGLGNRKYELLEIGN